MKISLTFIFCLIFSCQSFALWNRPTHMLSASIAYKILQKEDPATLKKVLDLLKLHPHYAVLWEPKLADIEDKDHYLFMLAARWADDVRSGDLSSYSHSKWHYTNFPFKPSNQSASLEVKQPDPENILSALQENRDAFKSDSVKNKAIALTWFFHLIGDIHQPLHTTALFTEQYPNGDRGGNLFFIREKENTAAVNLHAYWDDILLKSDLFTDVNTLSSDLLRKSNLRKAALKRDLSKKDFEKWAGESFELAKSKAYWNGTLTPGTTEVNANPLPSAYIPDARIVAERRIVLAGYRLAGFLREVLNES